MDLTYSDDLDGHIDHCYYNIWKKDVTTHLLIDFETMGIDVKNCAVVDVAWIFFEWEKFTKGPGYSFNDLVRMVNTVKFDVQDQVNRLGYKVDKSVVQWWKNLPPDVRKKAIPSSSDKKIEDFVRIFNRTLEANPPKYWWSRSNTFDPIILERLIQSAGEVEYSTWKQYCQYWAVRDTRTWIDSKLNWPDKNDFVPVSDLNSWNTYFKKHDSSHDVAADVLRLQRIARAEEGLEN